MILFYIIPMIICFCIAYCVFEDDWDADDYLAGGSIECVIMIMIAFIPIVNAVFSFLIVGIHLIRKLKRNQK